MKVDISYYKAGSRKGQVRKNHVVCSEIDAWNADWTIAQMVLPLLLQVKKDKQGAPFVDDVYVPEELRSTACASKENKRDTDDSWFKRYQYVLDEIIFAMQEVATYYENEPDMYEKVVEEAPETTTGEIDIGLKIIRHKTVLYTDYHARVQNGLMLFGVFFTSLWI